MIPMFGDKVPGRVSAGTSRALWMRTCGTEPGGPPPPGNRPRGIPVKTHVSRKLFKELTDLNIVQVAKASPVQR